MKITHIHTNSAMGPLGAHYITPDISSDFMHPEAGQSSHLFSESEITPSFPAVYYYYHYYHNCSTACVCTAFWL